MPDGQQTIYLADYTPYGFTVDSVHLTFQLDAHNTRVVSRIAFSPKPDADDPVFRLHGEHLKLISATIDGVAVTPSVEGDTLTCDVPDAPFIWEAIVEIDPAGNTALEGLYMSNGMYCTQCEAEGFRRITYYPDRPDVMSVFTVRIEGDAPVRLSNGNLTGEGDGWSEWHDPWPKPAYLFALVAGELDAHSDRFTTRSGRDVSLNIYVRPGDTHKCTYAMDALKRSMTWDEEVYGREYDLDIFNIVAVDDFNAGAMENKGLNIFNASYVLASPETATDANYETIEAVIAHEYFHNWTGNRITCRDWFQLCLKEGLTVFRDQQFTGDMRSVPVKRIEDAVTLRRGQFPEDAGPLAHPVRPDSFVEINNFYTATVYEKGAEVIGMLKRLVGDAEYDKAVDLYFTRHDGEAATIEDWLKVFEDSTGRDLSQFALWYSQAGTPRIDVTDDYSDGTYRLTLTQHTSPTPGQPDKAPFVIPVAVGVLAQDGSEIEPTRVFELSEAAHTYEFEGLWGKPIPSVLRGFSAPVILNQTLTSAERAVMLAHDTDPFNKWEAGRQLAQSALVAMVRDGAAPDAGYLEAIRAVANDDTLDPAFRALILSLPSQSELAQILFDGGTTPDPAAIYDAYQTLLDAMAETLDADLDRIYAANLVTGPYSPAAEDAGKRQLGNAMLNLISRIDGGLAAQNQFQTADNMTQSFMALGCLQRAGKGEAAVAEFGARWANDRQVTDKWFATQIINPDPLEAIALMQRLLAHPAFDRKNPNRFRSVLGSFAGYQAAFHHASGAGYKLLVDELITLDRVNPQTAARMVTPFETLHRWDDSRQALMRASLARLSNTDGLSNETQEMVTRILG